MPDLSPSLQIAILIHEGFDTFYAEFMRLTRECRQWFDARDWSRIHLESQRRIDLYQAYVSRTLETLRPLTDAYPQDLEVWQAAHEHYEDIVADRLDAEVAKTFFNAITRKIFRTVGVNDKIEFLQEDFDPRAEEDRPGLYRRFPRIPEPVELFEALLRYPQPALRWVDVRGEAAYLARRFEDALVRRWGDPGYDHVDVLGIVFFRVREAYIVGRVTRGTEHLPLIIPIQSTPTGVVVDGAIFDRRETLAVFSSTRAYMFVDVSEPSRLVRFLGTLMPELTLSELYISIAHHRHGKTLIYRELVEHLARTDDRFVIAPGIKGLVMTVFTMPGYRNVFKIIRDNFEKPGASRVAILRSYREVFRGRRVGRLADTQEFEHLAFDRARFEPQCLEELLSKASNTVRLVDDRVVVSHVYIEEKMTPLDIHLGQASIEEAERAVVDYGHAVKELAANNVFAGDLLWKNFGVTRFGRLVLYDYDEICPLLDCRFRTIPPARSWEEEIAAQHFYAAEQDVFPEEWEPFIVPRDPRLRAAFMNAHADLLDPAFWLRKQRDVRAGDLHIGLPYTPRYPELQHVPVHAFS